MNTLTSDKIEVTVIVPIYNSEAYLRECLNSLATQKDIHGNPFHDYRVILIDDGSVDSSADIALHFANTYHNLFEYVSQSNSGVSKTRNRGITLTSSNYVMFVDNDDKIDELYIWTHIHTISRTDADIVISGYQRFSDCKIHRAVIPQSGAWTKYRFMAPWAKIFRTEFLKKNRLYFFENNIGEDVVFLANAYTKTNRIEYLPYAGYYWRINDSSASNNIQRGLQQDCRVDRVLEQLAVLDATPERDLIDYFQFRYRVWYLLFSGRSASPERFEKIAGDFFKKWNSNALSRISPFANKISNEPISTRLIVLLFKLLARFRAFRLFAYLYCKG